MQTVTFKTLGCRLNQSETDALESKFRERGYEVRPFGESVDLTLINTCTVTHGADSDSRYAIRQAIRKSPKGRIVVTGCYAQMSPQEIAKIRGVDLILGNDQKFRLFDHLEKIEHGKLEDPLTFVNDSGTFDQVLDDAFVTTNSRTRAHLKIQDGCDYYCSFCIIPFARGKARSLPFTKAIQEAETLLQKGYREIVVTGVNLGTYFSEENGMPRRFADFLDRLQEIDGLERIRISSIEPNTVTHSLLKLMSRSSKICPHLHIPIQSADDEILNSMRRKYRTERLRRLVDKVREIQPDIALGTDVIVGFPGETEFHFEQTVRFLEEHEFSYLHVFPYSGRNGTAAEKLTSQVPSEIIKERSQIFRELSWKLKLNYHRKFLGQVMSVLFEEKEDEESNCGYTPNYLRVQIRSNQDLRGQIVKVKIGDSHDPSFLSGEIAQD